MTASTKDSTKTTYSYAGADMNKLLTQSTSGGAEYKYTYGTTDGQGVPVITSRTVTGTGTGTAPIVTDPGTGQPLDLQASDKSTSMWVLNGIGNPIAAITDSGSTAYKAAYDPHGAETVTDGGSPWPAAGPSATPSTHHSTRRTPTGTLTRATTL